MNDTELDALIAASAPIDDSDVERLELTGPEAELFEEIIWSASDPIDAHARGRGWRPRRRRILLAVAVAAGVVALVVPIRSTGNGQEAAYAAAILEVAESAPRLLVDLADWRVIRADQFGVDQGQVTFSNGESELVVSWFPASWYPAWVAEAAASTGPGVPTAVLGREAEIFVYRPPGASPARTGPGEDPGQLNASELGDFTALWTQGSHGVEARGQFPSLEGFQTVVAALVEVDVDTWLAAMPDDVVRPRGRAATVDAMLADVPLPAGLDVEALRQGDDRVRDRYQLGAEVTGAVVCAWIDSWVAATDAGDVAGVQRAVEAMATSHGWAILHEMQSQGAFPALIWRYADAMPTDTTIAGGRPLTIRESYQDTFGCSLRG